MEVGSARSRGSNLLEESAYGVTSNYGEVVTRYPYWKVWIGIPPLKDKIMRSEVLFDFASAFCLTATFEVAFGYYVPPPGNLPGGRNIMVLIFAVA